MSSKILIIFTTSTLLALYSSYSGLGLEEIKHEDVKSIRTGHSSSRGSSSGWSFGK